MGERIGKVFLDTTYYPGEDLYSDGVIEDEMLSIARDHTPEEFNQVIARRKSWPILYHFSHIRENILSWIPFKGDEKVLEVGAGCGAVTGALCRNAGEVTSIDLSMKRSRINAYRHRDQENLKILVGNFQEIEKNLTEKYDYITLIGVFEYGEAYIQSENPYVDFLKTIARHLKPDGKIILAIENRLGLKYWAGCTEDHFGILFEGLEGYPRTRGVKTFTRKEFRQILKQAGELKASWYYPFPDYKFPMAVYSEKYLPAKGELNRTEYNFDRFRLQLFQESPVYDTLLDNDLYQEFANSFLLMIGREQPEVETVYTKFSNERDRKFAIRTEIGLTENGSRTVRKLPEAKEAEVHVNNLEKICTELGKLYGPAGIRVSSCKAQPKAAEFEYLTGITLEEKLDTLLENGEEDQAEALLFSYVNKVKQIHEKERFHRTAGFTKVFGEVTLSEELKSAPVSNIDLVPANVILNGEAATVIDYEWTFFFPVPSNFLVYRMIHYYLESDGKRESLKKRGFYEKAGLTQEECRTYRMMEKNFQKYMLGSHHAMQNLYGSISPGKADAVQLYEERKREASQTLQVFWDAGRDFNEEDSRRYPIKNREIRVRFTLPDHTEKLRLDPGELQCGLYIRKLCWENGAPVKFVTEGCYLGGGVYYFGVEDPQIIINEIPEKAGVMEIHLEFTDEKEARQKFWQKYKDKEQDLYQIRRDFKKKESMRKVMEDSHLWQIYCKLKKM